MSRSHDPAAQQGAPQPDRQPPHTRTEPVSDLLHGQAIVDPYRWLEGDNGDPAQMGRSTPEVAAWTAAQNAHTRAVLDAMPGRRALEERMRPLLEIGSVSLPRVRGGRWFFGKREGSQDQAVVYWREGEQGEDRVLIDPHLLDPSGLTTVTWTSPSPDGRLLAYGSYRSGDENTTLHLLEVDSGRRLPLTIPNKVQEPQWLPDGSGFVYHNLRDPENPYSGRVMFHRLGHEPADDPVLFRQLTPEEDPQLATTWGPFGHLSEDGRWLLLGYWRDGRSTDLWLASMEDFLAGGVLERRPVSLGSEGVAFGTVVGGQLYLSTTKGAAKGRVVVAPVAAPEEANWRDLVPEREEAVISGTSVTERRIALTYLHQASNFTEVFDLDGRSLGRLMQPGIGSTTLATEADRSQAYLSFSSFHQPDSVYRVDLDRPQEQPVLWQAPELPVDVSDVRVEQVWYPSKDGTPISMFLVHREGIRKDGRTPTILYGYGGFNISMTPSFSASMLPWYQDGGLLAMPNLRGGGEYGDAWHEAGMRARKQNVFDDFIAAAEWLVAQGYTSSERLAVAGGSNGGLLTGAFLSQRPELARAALVQVPLLDMLRYQHFLMARYWVPEYGSAEEADAFGWLRAYSPYHRVEQGVAYPAVFLTAGEHDRRVHALHARKMAAALQAATASDPAERPVLLWVDQEAGHGQGKPLHLRLREVVDLRIFLMGQLGMLEG